MVQVTAACMGSTHLHRMVRERRKHRRVQLRTPIRGAVGDARVFLTDSSIGGLGLAHQGTLPAPGGIIRLELVSDWGPIRVDCQVVRTVERSTTQTQTQTQRPVYQSGLQIVVMDHQSSQRLQTMLATVSHDDF